MHLSGATFRFFVKDDLINGAPIEKRIHRKRLLSISLTPFLLLLVGPSVQDEAQQ